MATKKASFHTSNWILTLRSLQCFFICHISVIIFFSFFANLTSFLFLLTAAPDRAVLEKRTALCGAKGKKTLRINYKTQLHRKYSEKKTQLTVRRSKNYHSFCFCLRTIGSFVSPLLLALFNHSKHVSPVSGQRTVVCVEPICHPQPPRLKGETGVKMPRSTVSEKRKTLEIAQSFVDPMLKCLNTAKQEYLCCNFQ